MHRITCGAHCGHGHRRVHIIVILVAFLSLRHQVEGTYVFGSSLHDGTASLAFQCLHWWAAQVISSHKFFRTWSAMGSLHRLSIAELRVG